MKVDQTYLDRLLLAFASAPGSTTDIKYLEMMGFNRDEKFLLHLRMLNNADLIQREDGGTGFGYVRGADGYETWSVLPLSLTQRGHERIASLENLNRENITELTKKDVADEQAHGTTHRPEGDMKVFISHSSADRSIAAAFAELIRAALRLSANDIRCTSVDGYKLPAGTNADEQLRLEVFESQAFVGLLSPVSMKSVYVMFELGARWGAKRRLAPVMIGGLDASALKAPLSAMHAVNGGSESDVHQLIDTLGEWVGVVPEKPHAYLKALKGFVEEAARTSPNP